MTAGLFTINWLTSTDSWWFYWPLIGTGIGRGIGPVIHGVNKFATGSIVSKEWEERKARELLDRDQTGV